MLEVILERFEQRDEVRTFEKGKFEVVWLGGMTIGPATYEPVGMVVSGRATAATDDGRVFEMKPGDVFYIAPGPDSWVVGDEP
jgi:uncharacterized cupin superfamily protein